MNPGHVFVCGRPAPDLTARLRARRTNRFEMSVTPDRLDARCPESGLVGTVTPGTENDVREAVSVREAVHRPVTGRRPGEGLDREALAVLDAAARRTPATPQLTRTGRSGAFRGRRRLGLRGRHDGSPAR
ncbi:ABATE domain-containing protein [Streptomyces sp. NPDC093094]|uniref:ABATE domain-containing protein n=1 Tax=Streptomyces sp. NPDC093094 TaxID=3366026 RepID=UPI0037FFFB37